MRTADVLRLNRPSARPPTPVTQAFTDRGATVEEVKLDGDIKKCTLKDERYRIKYHGY
jgi:hypothetical protein